MTYQDDAIRNLCCSILVQAVEDLRAIRRGEGPRQAWMRPEGALAQRRAMERVEELKEFFYSEHYSQLCQVAGVSEEALREKI